MAYVFIKALEKQQFDFFFKDKLGVIHIHSQFERGVLRYKDIWGIYFFFLVFSCWLVVYFIWFG